MRNFMADYIMARNFSGAFAIGTASAFEGIDMTEFRKAVVAARSNFMDLIANEGPEYYDVFGIATHNVRAENDGIDIDTVKIENVPMTVKVFRENAVKSFTYSGSSSSATETVWAFVSAGCVIKGMTMVNSVCTNWDGTHEKVPAFIFEIPDAVEI